MIETNEKLNVHGGWREEDGKITGIISLLKKRPVREEAVSRFCHVWLAFKVIWSLWIQAALDQMANFMYQAWASSPLGSDFSPARKRVLELQ